MTAKGIYINVSRRNEDIPELIDEFSETLNSSKADTVSEIIWSYPKLVLDFSSNLSQVRRRTSLVGYIDCHTGFI